MKKIRFTTKVLVISSLSITLLLLSAVAILFYTRNEINLISNKTKSSIELYEKINDLKIVFKRELLNRKNILLSKKSLILNKKYHQEIERDFSAIKLKTLELLNSDQTEILDDIEKFYLHHQLLSKTNQNQKKFILSQERIEFHHQMAIKSLHRASDFMADKIERIEDNGTKKMARIFNYSLLILISISILAILITVTLSKRISHFYKENIKIEKNNNFLENVIGSLPSLVSYIDKNYTYQFVSPQYEEWFSIPAKNILRKKISEIIGEVAFNFAKPYLDQAFEGKKVKYEKKMPYIHGGTRVVQFFYLPDFDENQNVRGVYTIATDITESRKNELELSQMLNSINQTAIVAITNKEGIIISANDNFCKISEYSREELIGQNHRVLNSGAHPKSYFNGMWSDLLNGKTWSGEIENKTKSGKHYFVQTVISPIRNLDGVIDRFMAIRFDITKEREMENELNIEKAKALHSAKLASLGEMSASIAHEINNPLAIIQGSAHLISKMNIDNEKLQQKIESIKNSALRIGKIVGGLRKFARTTENTIYEEKKLELIIQESLNLTEAKAKLNAVTITTHLNSKGTIFCDEVEIEQVLVNLINNAVDAVKLLSEKWIIISLFEINDQLVVQITDSGNGISPQVEHKLFQPFFTTKPVGEGTGLGLSICRGILQNHKATIELNRSIKNTCFEIKFMKSKQEQGAA